MTLIELVAGLTITGITISAGYAGFATMVDHRARAEALVDATTRAADGRRAIAGWLQAARLEVEQTGPLFRGMDGVYRGMPDDELSLLSGPTLVRLYIDRDTLTAERGLSAELSRWPDPRVERFEIEPRAAGLDLRYSTSALGRIEWLPSWISSTVLPLGVEMTVLPEPRDSLPALLALPIVVPVGAAR
jgi:type II secretory pathway pseudopilin PulG